MEQSSSDLPAGVVVLFSPLFSPLLLPLFSLLFSPLFSPLFSLLSTQAEVAVVVGLSMLRKEVIIFFSPILVHLVVHHQTTYQVVHALVAAVQRVVAQRVGYCQFLVSVVVEARYLHVVVTSFSWC